MHTSHVQGFRTELCYVSCGGGKRKSYNNINVHEKKKLTEHTKM